MFVCAPATIEIQREKMSSKLSETPIATARKRLSNNEKLAIIEASKSPGFNREEAIKKWGIRTELLKNKKVMKTKLNESPVKSAKRASGLPQKQIEFEDRLFRWIGLNERRGMFFPFTSSSRLKA